MPFFRHFLIGITCCFTINIAQAADLTSLDAALRATYTACVSIDDELADLKKMAGINTAVTAVGTAAGAGATVVGIVKTSKDAEAEELERLITELKELEQGKPDATDDEIQEFLAQFESSYDTAIKDLETAQKQLNKTTQQSKRLGNWRTGLIAGSTATNLAGAIIAGNNKVNKDLQLQINNCKSAVSNLRNSMMQARIDGIDVTEANQVIAACGEYDYIDLSPINNRSNGAMISSIIGTTMGTAGTVTSVIANTDAIRNNNTEPGKEKEKNLNTAANVLSGATTVASATATIFNATQISAIKKVAYVAEKCTGVLK